MSAFEGALTDALLMLPSHLRETVSIKTAMQEMEATRETIQPVAKPRLYQVESTSRCNLRCPFCPRTTDMVPNRRRNPTEDLPMAAFTALLDQMPWVRSLELFHFGEPFMDPRLSDFIFACSSREIDATIATNLLPATPYAIEQAFDAGLDFMVVDLDSLDDEQYGRARPPGRLSLLKPKLKYALSRQEPKPHIVVQQIDLRESLGIEPYTMAELMEWLGPDVPPPDQLRTKFLDSFRGESAPPTPLGPDDLCREAFYGFTVHANGNVVPCDRDWAGENVMGNIHEQSVDAIWRGERYEAFRAAMKSRKKPRMCRDCCEGRLVNLRSQPCIQVNQFDGSRLEHP